MPIFTTFSCAKAGVPKPASVVAAVPAMKLRRSSFICVSSDLLCVNSNSARRVGEGAVQYHRLSTRSVQRRAHRDAVEDGGHGAQARAHSASQTRVNALMAHPTDRCSIAWHIGTATPGSNCG